MKKRRKKIGGGFRSSSRKQDARPPMIEMEPEELAGYIRQAEKQALPIIKEKQVGPGAAQLLLALYTQTIVTGNPDLTPESGMSTANRILTLWQTGYYIPGPEYPYTLDETLQDVQQGLNGKEGYAACFIPFASTSGRKPSGVGQLAGGIVRHPETQLWQIWIILEGPCVYVGAFRDPEKAQRNLEEIISTAGCGGSLMEAETLCRKVLSRADGPSKQLPGDMMTYLMEHIHQFEIEL